jgi:pilus assembly protein CpaF
VWVDRGAGLVAVGEMSAAAVASAIERILAPVGRRLDRAHPSVDARLPNGARVCAVLPPVAVDGTCLAIRRFADHGWSVTDFATAPVADLLVQLVRRRCNVVVSGATSAGKTSLLAAMASQAGGNERLVMLEDIAELVIPHPHLVRLETRPASPDGVEAVDLAGLLRVALRLRPDRLIVGEVRGNEAEQLVQAMNTGHDGSLATVHANGALDALDRLATLVSCSAPAWPGAAIAAHLSRAVDAVVHVQRGADGARRVTEVVEVSTPDDRGLARGRSLVAKGVQVAEVSRWRR